MTIRTTLIITAITMSTVLSIILAILFFFEAKERIIEGYVEKARSVVLSAESTREEMEDKWEKGLFTVEQLREYANKNEKEKLLAAVPVVTAWQAAMKKSKEGGYTFKTPKFEPRNPKNQPDPVEADAINYLKQSKADEYYMIDGAMNAIRYFRPVVLSERCMYCHGNPSLSKKYWDNDRGLDALGKKMEGWSVGSIHGAFEVVQSLDGADQKVMTMLFKIILFVVIILAVSGLLFYFTLEKLENHQMMDRGALT